MKTIISHNLKQLVLIALILFIGIMLVKELSYFIPGFLGAITLYIIFRQFHTKLVNVYGWKKWISAIVIILISIVFFLVPIYFIIHLLIPKFNYAFNNVDLLFENIDSMILNLQEFIPQLDFSKDKFQGYISRLAGYLPGVINATFSVLTNTLSALFVLYFMLVNADVMEDVIHKFLPMNEANKDSLWLETRRMVVSNAIGIPVLIMAQGFIATIGYYIFGVEQPIVWGVLTGVASIIPVVGTVVLWAPLSVYLILEGLIGPGVGLLLYGTILISNIDNVLRFTLLKKIGDVHPLITVFGVIAGLNIFGLMGLIFGPLLISYFFLLIKIYRTEF